MWPLLGSVPTVHDKNHWVKHCIEKGEQQRKPFLLNNITTYDTTRKKWTSHQYIAQLNYLPILSENPSTDFKIPWWKFPDVKTHRKNKLRSGFHDFAHTYGRLQLAIYVSKDFHITITRHIVLWRQLFISQQFLFLIFFFPSFFPEHINCKTLPTCFIVQTMRGWQRTWATHDRC